jgi:hypothetical protein
MSSFYKTFLSFSLLKLSSKTKKNKNKNDGQGCSALPTIATAPWIVTRCRPSPWIAALPVITASCSTAGHPHNNKLQRTDNLATIASSNTLLTSLQRCIARSYSVVPPLAIVATPTKLCSSDVRWIFVGLSSDFRPMFVRHSSNFHPTFVGHQSCAPSSCILLSCRLASWRLTPWCPTILSSCCFFHPTSIWLPSDLRPTFVGRLFDLCAMFVERGLFPTIHYIIQIVHCVFS